MKAPAHGPVLWMSNAAADNALCIGRKEPSRLGAEVQR